MTAWDAGVRTVAVKQAKDRFAAQLVPVAESRAAVVWLANMSALELHIPLWTVAPDGSPRDYDRLVIDLDPGSGAGPRAALRHSPPAGTPGRRSPVGAATVSPAR